MGRIFGICDVPVKTFEAVWQPYRIAEPRLPQIGFLKGDAFIGKAEELANKNKVRYFFRRILNPNSKALKK